MPETHTWPAEIESDPVMLPERQQVAQAARQLLVGQLALSHAPITGRHVGCVLETSDGQLVAGHNYESESPVDFRHAEANALDAAYVITADAAIRSVYMAGEDPRLTGQQFKNITPCTDCYGLLEPRFAPDAELVLFEPNMLRRALIFSPNEYRPAYGKLPFSALSAMNREDIIQELREKTPLDDKDRAVAADLRLLGLSLGVAFYLTGSASGRGWMSTAIHNKLGTDYGDMDILAVTDSYDNRKLKQAVHSIINEHHGPTSDETIETEFWVVCGKNRGALRRVAYDSFFTDDRKVMDFSQAPTLEEGMLRDDYLANNYYHQLS